MYHGVCACVEEAQGGHIEEDCTGLGGSTGPGDSGKGGKLTPGKVGAPQIS